MTNDALPGDSAVQTQVLIESWRHAARLAADEVRTFWCRIAIIAGVNVVLLGTLSFLIHGGLSNAQVHAFSIRRLAALLTITLVASLLAWFVALAVRRSIGYQRFFEAKAREAEQRVRAHAGGDHPRLWTDAEQMDEVSVRVLDRNHKLRGVSSFTIAEVSTFVVAIVWSSLAVVYACALVARTVR